MSAVRDADAIGTLLSSEHNYSVERLTDGAATGGAILGHLRDTLPGRLSAESGFLLYFAGHGKAIGDGTEGPQGYLLPQDASAADEDSWLSMETLRKTVEALSCRHLFIVLDCCFAGSFRWASTRGLAAGRRPLYESQLKRYVQGDAWQALTSASHDEEAADVLPGRSNARDQGDLDDHSPFAAALIRGLSGAADSARGGYEPDGVITATELYQYIFEEIMPAGEESSQTPGIWPLKPGNTGEFIFMNPQAELNTRPDPPLDDSNNPWMGLKAYSMAEESLFFGRQQVVEDLLDRVLDDTAGSLLAVVGASGTGKSSAVKAGLLPSLTDPGEDLRERVGNWTLIESPRLRLHPLVQLDQVRRELDAAPADTRKVVLVDQFEELYTQCPNQDERDRYLQGLRDLIDRENGPQVIVTIRSDFEPRPESSKFLKDIWPAARFLVPAFSTDDLREVIEGPAKIKALYFDPSELVGTIVDEVAAMPGALPLLSFALAEMYRRAQIRRRETGALDRALSQEDYEAIGGVVGALHQRASVLYDNCDELHQATIRRVFLRMLTQDGARLARRRVVRTELSFDDEDEQRRVDKVLDMYIEARLLVVDGDFIEPAHDTLVAAWEYLQDWLADAGPQDLVRSVWQDARSWDDHERNSGYLWNADPRLPQAKSAIAELNSLEQAFITASSRRRSRQFVSIAAITVAVIISLSFATWYSFNQAQVAQEQLAEARYQNGRALLEQANQRLADGAHFAAAMLAAEAIGFRGYGADGSEGAAEKFRQLVSTEKPEHDPLVQTLTKATMASFRPVAWRPLAQGIFSPSGPLFAGVTAQGSVELWNLEDGTRTELAIPLEDADETVRLIFSNDGSRLAAFADWADQVVLWRIDDTVIEEPPELLQLPNTNREFVAAFSGDGSKLAVGTEGPAVVYALGNSAEEVSAITTTLHDEELPYMLHSLAFSRDAGDLIMGGHQDDIVQRDLAAGRSRFVGREWDRWAENVQKGDHVTSLVFGPEEKFVYAVSANRLVRGPIVDGLADFSRGEPFFETNRAIDAMKLSPRGTEIAISSVAGVVLLSVPQLEVISRFDWIYEEHDVILNLSFSADGSLLALSSDARTEIRDVTSMRNREFKIAEEIFDHSATTATWGDSQRLREFVEGDEFDCFFAVGRFKRQERNETDTVRCKFTETEYRFTAEYPTDSDEDWIEARLAGQPEPGNLVAVGNDRFTNQLDGSIRIDLYDTETANHVMSITSANEFEWGMDGLHFDTDQHWLWSKHSNFDGYTLGVYRWPVFRPDLTVYIEPVECQAPVNWPGASELDPELVFQCP